MKAEPKNQLEFQLARVLLVPGEGELTGEKSVRFPEWFLREVLKVEQYYLDYNNPGVRPANFICNFCNEGRLKLERVVPVKAGLPKRHIANYYYYGCTEHCGGEFFGRAYFENEIN